MVERFAAWFSNLASRSPAFLFAVGVVVAWTAGGLAQRQFSDAYQLPINTITTIVNFVLGFAILNAQRRDTLALHAKLDALLHAVAGAPDSLVRAEQRTAKEIEALREELDDDCPCDDRST